MTEHLPIQRWVIRHVAGDAYIDKEPEGSWVTYPDHLAALRACEQRVLAAAEQAIRDALSGDGRNLYAELTALAAIDALRKDER